MKFTQSFFLKKSTTKTLFEFSTFQEFEELIITD